ncbi:hypothetical protein Fmac_005093 [Flemingia macrophylla]|uniref:Protein EXORDIUM-like 2 n=1 Tax=Flemingia macrophylla TaxID=520843 RepID=A0ABD1N754_9FABA
MRRRHVERCEVDTSYATVFPSHYINSHIHPHREIKSNPLNNMMAHNYKTALTLSAVLVLILPLLTAGELVQNQLKYHNGELLKGRIAVNLVWYGTFTPVQRSIIVDFINSLGARNVARPSAATWWSTTNSYLKGGSTTLVVGKQLLKPAYALGKRLSDRDLLALASELNAVNSITVVLTAKDVAVDRFCMDRCGTHGSLRDAKTGSRRAYIWVGNSEAQCPGTCAWPFHRPIYGPQTPPLVAPNGDVGVDGMIINLASLLAGTVTNPFNTGYYEGSPLAPVEAGSACTGCSGAGRTRVTRVGFSLIGLLGRASMPTAPTGGGSWCRRCGTPWFRIARL